MVKNINNTITETALDLLTEKHHPLATPQNTYSFVEAPVKRFFFTLYYSEKALLSVLKGL